MSDLSFPDQYGVGRLKNLRVRSLANKSYRDDDFLRKFVTFRPPLSWEQDSPLRPLREEIVRHLDDVRRAKQHGDAGTVDDSWKAALRAVDELVNQAEKLNGARIRVWA